MRCAFRSLLFALALAGCKTKAHKVQQLQAQYNAEYPTFAKACLDEDSSGAAQLLTGEKVTAQEIADLKAKKKAREAACKPQADHLAQLQKQILAAQQ